MKIHIVQKGESLWSIAEKYDVDFQQLVDLNTQLASPEMIMPGMKIRIPVLTKEKPEHKNKEKLQLDQIPTKPIYHLAEDDHHKPRDFEIEKPDIEVNKTLPVMDEMNNQLDVGENKQQHLNMMEQEQNHLYMPIYVPIYYPYYYPVRSMSCPFCGFSEASSTEQATQTPFRNEEEKAAETLAIQVKAPPTLSNAFQQPREIGVE